MGQVMDEMLAIYNGDDPIDIYDDELAHIGIKYRSGRYPYGSGENPFQHDGDFLGRVEEMRRDGFTYYDENTGKTYTGDTAIARSMGLSTTQFRTEISICKDERRMANVARAKSLREDGLNNSQIAREMGVNESTVRSWFDSDSESRMYQARETAAFIKEQIDTKGMIDIGAGVERELDISKERLREAVQLLEREGYPVYSGRIPQATNPGKHTTQKVICPPGTPHKDIYNYDQVHSLKEYVSQDGGDTFHKKFVYPKSMDSKRLMIRYDEDGGTEKDGIVELRRGVDDLSLGNSRYSQVRILVDDTKYIKGMALYSDDMPDGVDVIFNTNKKRADHPDKLDVLKDIKKDPDNPFGSLIKEKGGQSYYFDKNGKEQLSLINKRADEGDWEEWADALPSQFLGKQSRALAQKQLNLAKADKLAEYDDICSLNNPTIKKHLLAKFADECDSAAVHLKAAALPGQKYHVIIPVNTLKDNEVYAPRYENGTKLALVRYPHGGTFEIPILTVNNKHPQAKKLIGSTSIDAVGINKKIADQLSGADFDGDTVMCIPTHDKSGKVKITSTPPLKGLEGFDPKLSYGYDDVKTDADGTKHYYRGGKEFRVMKSATTQTQMGVVSNLITDMTLAGASQDELARAVRHSMVVIDAEKHKLDYRQSEIDNNIAALKKAYQQKGNGKSGGASTILSKAKGEYTVDKRQGSGYVNIKGKDGYDPTRPEGALIFKTTDDLYYEKKKVNKRTGEVTTITKKKTQPSTQMAETDDAYSLVSDARHPMELIYADYANNMKALANQARKEMVSTGKIKYDSTANKTYKPEVDSLKSKLNNALKNNPKEREAQRRANAEVSAKVKEYKETTGTDMKKKDIKKANQMALSKARTDVGSVSRRDRNIEITDKEWEAIQAGAISENILKQILNNTDVDDLRQRAMPKATNTLSQAKINKIRQMSRSNFSLEEIAKSCGCSTSVVSKYLKGVN